MVAATLLVIAVFLEWYSLSTDRAWSRGERSGQLGLRGREHELQRLDTFPILDLAAARGGRGAVDPRLDRDPRPRALLAARRGDRDRRPDRVR